MSNFHEIVEESSTLTLDEQESFVEILKKRITVEKRKRIIAEVKESIEEFEKGNREISTIDDIMEEIIS